MKLKNSFEFVTISDEMTAIPIGDNSFKGILIINETMKDMLEIMGMGSFTIDSIVNMMEHKYTIISKEELYNTVRNICSNLIDKGIVEE